MSASQRRVAASIAVFRNGQVLLAQRSKPGSRGLWSLPGGHVEPGETHSDAALRELREETGVVADILGEAGVVAIAAQSANDALVHYDLTVFYARWRSGDGQAGSDCMAIKWADLATLDEDEMTKGTAAIIRKANLLEGGG